MERLMLSCNSNPLNSLENLSESHLGWAGIVREHMIGEEKYTILENTPNKKSSTILIQGHTDYAIAQMKGAIKDGLRVAKTLIKTRSYVPEAGAIEMFLYRKLIVNCY